MTESSTISTSSGMHGQRSRDLIGELKGAENLMAYNDEAVRAIIQETQTLANEVETIALEGSNGVIADKMKAPAQVYAHSVNRNRRCLLAYHSRRCDLVEDARWKFGSVLPPEIRDKMNSAEVDYFKQYSDLLASFMTATGIDILSDLQPPKDNFVEVIASRDCGVLMTLSGPRDVRKDEVHFVRRYDAEPLIRLGWLRHVSETD